MPTRSPIAPDEAYDHLQTRSREDRDAEKDASAGWMLMGEGNTYPGEWDFDLTPAECRDGVRVMSGEHAGEYVIPERFEVDARLLLAERRKDNGKPRLGTMKRIHITTQADLAALREQKMPGLPREARKSWGAMERLREAYPDPFAYGNSMGGGSQGGVLGQFLPLWPGPVTRQLYWQDYFAMSAKAFEAYNHDPVSWRCVHMKQEFALGKGLQARVTYSSGGKAGQSHDQAQAAWDEFWKRNKMDVRLDMIARDLSWGGEQFLRYFTKGPLTTVRSLDPASIYDLIADPEDLETVFAYHQQFQTAYQLYPPSTSKTQPVVQSPFGPTDPGAATKYIIRQIAPAEIDHYRINQSAYERRGRSDLFPGLGWIKRLRDYLVSHVIRADMLSRICWDLKVQGNAATVQTLRNMLFPNGQAPPPGSVFGHNSASELTAMVPTSSGGGGRWDPVLDGLVTMVANSIGLPKDWLGFGMGTTRASALVATEPAARSLEDLQGTCEMILHDQFERVMATAKITDADVEFTFPSIATEDRTQKLQDLAYAEANTWISHQTAASIGAKELGITGYDYEEEMKLITSEFEQVEEKEPDPDGTPNPITGKPAEKSKQGDGVMRRPMLVASMRQAPKLDPTKAMPQEDEPPGLLVPAVAGAPGAPAGAGGPAAGGNGGPAANGNGNGNGKTAPTRNGFPAAENPASGVGAANIKADLKESEVMVPLSQVRAIVETIMRESRPTHPFERAAAAFHDETAANLAELVRVAGATETGNRE